MRKKTVVEVKIPVEIKGFQTPLKTDSVEIFWNISYVGKQSNVNNEKFFVGLFVYKK